MQNIEMETEDTPFVIAARCHLPQGDGFLAAAGKFPAQLKGVPLGELPSECEAEGVATQKTSAEADVFAWCIIF